MRPIANRLMPICILLKILQNKGRIHGNRVADGWAGAAMRKPLTIRECDGPTDGPTNDHLIRFTLIKAQKVAHASEPVVAYAIYLRYAKRL